MCQAGQHVVPGGGEPVREQAAAVHQEEHVEIAACDGDRDLDLGQAVPGVYVGGFGGLRHAVADDNRVHVERQLPRGTAHPPLWLAGAVQPQPDLQAVDLASVIITGRNPDRLKRAAAEVGAERTAAFDATDSGQLETFFQQLPTPIDHVLVTGPGPYYAPLADLDRERAHHGFDAHLWLAVTVAQQAVGKVRAGGTLLFMAGTSGERGPGLSLAVAATAALPALIANLAVEVAPVRVNLIAAGFVDTPLSGSLLGKDLEARRDQLRATLPIGRVVGPADVAAHIMANTALTDGSYDIDGGQQLISS